MGNARRLTWMGLLLFQIISIGFFVAYQEMRIRQGTEVILEAAVVDPRDWLRGEYADLRYGISEMIVSPYSTVTLDGFCCIDAHARKGDHVGVNLWVDPGDGIGVIASSPIENLDPVTDTLPEDGMHKVWYISEGAAVDFEDVITIKGTIENIEQIALDKRGEQVNRYTISYGIEKVFMPEGEPRELEEATDIRTIVSVDGTGQARVSGIIVDGVTWPIR